MSENIFYDSLKFGTLVWSYLRGDDKNQVLNYILYKLNFSIILHITHSIESLESALNYTLTRF